MFNTSHANGVASDITLPFPSALLQADGSVDSIAARRCFAQLDQNGRGFVSAHDLQQFLTRFIAQHQQPRRRSDDEHKESHDATAFSTSSSLPSSAAASHSTSSSLPSRSDAAASSSSSSSSPDDIQSLVTAASSLTPADLSSLINLFDISSFDGRLDVHEFQAALDAFLTPPVSLTKERFESAIPRLGVERGKRTAGNQREMDDGRRRSPVVQQRQQQQQSVLRESLSPQPPSTARSPFPLQSSTPSTSSFGASASISHPPSMFATASHTLSQHPPAPLSVTAAASSSSSEPAFSSYMPAQSQLRDSFPR